MPKQVITYGLFGNSKVVRDEEGYVRIPIIVQETGMMVRGVPEELCIRDNSRLQAY